MFELTNWDGRALASLQQFSRTESRVSDLRLVHSPIQDLDSGSSQAITLPQMTEIRLGVVGTGLAFIELHLPILARLSKRFRIVSLYSRSADRASAAVQHVTRSCGYTPDVASTVESLLARSDIDAVDIAVPISFATSLAMNAIVSGKHVFLEKPIGDDPDKARDLIASAAHEKLVLQVGENFRYQARFYQLRDIVASGALGAPQLYRLNDLHNTPADSKYAATQWRRDGNHRGGYLLDGGTHIIAGMRAMVGSAVASISALTASFDPTLFGHQPDTALVNIVYSNGLIGQMALGYGAVDRDARRPKIYGSQGTAVLFADHIEIWRAGATDSLSVPLTAADQGFLGEWLDFHAAICHGGRLFGTPEDALIDLSLVTAILDSADRHSAVSLPEYLERSTGAPPSPDLGLAS